MSVSLREYEGPLGLVLYGDSFDSSSDPRTPPRLQLPVCHQTLEPSQPGKTKMDLWKGRRGPRGGTGKPRRVEPTDAHLSPEASSQPWPVGWWPDVLVPLCCLFTGWLPPEVAPLFNHLNPVHAVPSLASSHARTLQSLLDAKLLLGLVQVGWPISLPVPVRTPTYAHAYAHAHARARALFHAIHPMATHGCLCPCPCPCPCSSYPPCN